MQDITRDTVRQDRDDHLNRPQVQRLPFPMLRGMGNGCCAEARDDDAVKVVVLTGASDKAFCSGVDLGSISNANPDLTPLERKSQLHDEVHGWPVPSPTSTNRSSPPSTASR